MKSILYCLLFLPFMLLAQATPKSSEMFCTNDYNGGQFIRIKWIYTTVYHPNGMDIYRQEKGASEWIKLNTEAILPVKNLPAGNKLDDEAKALHKALIESKFSEFSTSPLRAFVLIKALLSDELASYIGITFSDKNVEVGKEYQYKIAVSGTTTEIGRSKFITAAAYIKIAPPENALLKRYKKHIDISWKPDIYRYYAVDIYKRTSEETTFKKVNNVPRAIQKEQAEKYTEKSVFYQDTNIVYNANYIYKFVALDYFGQPSEMSEEYSVPTADFIPPALPYDVMPTASSLKSNVRLDWKLMDEKDLAGTNIYWSSSPDKTFQKINKELIPNTELSFTHTGITTGSHYYKVASVDASGNESYSAPVFAELKDLAPPAKPTGLVSTSGEGFITLTWQANTEADLKGYHVQRSIKSNSKINSSYVNVTKNPINQTTYTEELPKNVRNEFVYRIVAIDTNFNRSIPSENTLARMPDVTPPQQAVIKNISSDTASALITWLANADPDLAGYTLYKEIAGDSLNLQKVNFNLIPAGIVSYTDRRIKAGVSYTYFLEAVDSSGNSSKRSPGFFTKIPELKMSGSIKVDSKKYNNKKGMLQLEWTAETKEEVKGFVVFHQQTTDVPFKPICGLLKENQLDVALKDKSGNYYIKCYTANGKIIQSETFVISGE